MSCAARVLIAFAWVWLGLGSALPARAQLTWADVLTFKAPPETPSYAPTRLAKTVADDCFDGIGVDYPPINPDGSCNQGIAKKNQAYVWGLTQAGVGDSAFNGDEIWFGSVANPLCGGAAGITEPEPELTVSWVCEYGLSMQARRPRHPLPPAAGDWRLPRAYSYNLRTRQLTDRTPHDRSFLTLAGLRSAGSLGAIVFMAGPTFDGNVTFAAWNAATGTYLGSCTATALNNIRQWIAVNGVLYAAVGREAGDGAILRWRGSLADPFNGAASGSTYCGFQVVGVVPGFPSYVASVDGKRLAVSVWVKNRGSGENTGLAAPGAPYASGVYIGPPFGAQGGYTRVDAKTAWSKIWGPNQYETDPVVAASMGGGAIAFWKGYLWWGSMHNTSSTTLAHSSCSLPICFGVPSNSEENIRLLFNVSRAVSIWRARLLETGQVEVELLYGETALPALIPGTKDFEMRSTGWTPRFGTSGFDNPFLTYTWSVSADQDDLLFGLYDYRYVFDVKFGIIPPPNVGARRPGPAAGATGSRGPVDPARGYGADLWRFAATDQPARAESVHGLGNFTNYGVRTLLRLDQTRDVILGTANGLSLEPEGGWELHLLAAPPQGAPPRRSTRR